MAFIHWFSRQCCNCLWVLVLALNVYQYRSGFVISPLDLIRHVKKWSNTLVLASIRNPSGPVVYIQMILFFRRLFIIYRFCSGPIQLSPFFQRFAWVLLYNILSTTTTYFWSYLFESILPHTPIFKVFYFLLFVSI